MLVWIWVQIAGFRFWCRWELQEFGVGERNRDWQSALLGR